MVASLSKSVHPLTAKQYGRTFLDVSAKYSFAKDVTVVPLLLNEFAAASNEFPIVFTRGNNQLRAVAVLGFPQHGNLYLGNDGGWCGKYIPASLRLFPFVLMRMDETKMALGLSEAHPGLNNRGEGMPLFDESGEAAPLVLRVKEYANKYSNDITLTERFLTELSGLDILSDVQLRLRARDGSEHIFNGLATVDRRKLLSLHSDKLQGLVSSGSLEAIYAHLASLKNFRSLAHRFGETSDFSEEIRTEADVSM